MAEYILGLSGSQEDSSVVLFKKGSNEPELMLTEDRHSGVTHFFGFPWMGINKAIEFAGAENIVKVAYARDKNCFITPHDEYFKPLLSEKDEKFIREQIPLLFNKLSAEYPHMDFLKEDVGNMLEQLNIDEDKLLHLKKRINYLVLKFANELFTERQVRKLLPDVEIEGFNHHETHAAGCFTKKSEHSAVITWDGRGEFDTLVLWELKNNRLRREDTIVHPFSLGMFYEIFAEFLGFGRAPGPGKLMGLSSYGDRRFVEKFREMVVVKEGEFNFTFNDKYIYCSQNERMRMTDSLREIVGEPRGRYDEITDHHKAIAKAVQVVLEDVATHLVQVALDKFGTKNVFFGGGVALNCVMNEVLRERLDINLEILPVCGDQGVSLGAAILSKYRDEGYAERITFDKNYGLGNDAEEIESYLRENDLVFTEGTAGEMAEMLQENKIIGIVKGKYELGPRALCSRSILANPTYFSNWDKINHEVKFREDFRPFAPVMLEEEAEQFWGDNSNFTPSPYMLLAPKFNKTAKEAIPAVVHVDSTSRLQTINSDYNPFVVSVLEEFKKLSGIGCLLNTSLNMSGESIIIDFKDMIDFLAVSNLDGAYIDGWMIKKAGNEKALETIAGRYAERKDYVDKRWNRYTDFLKENGYELKAIGFNEMYQLIFGEKVKVTLPECG